MKMKIEDTAEEGGEDDKGKEVNLGWSHQQQIFQWRYVKQHRDNAPTN